MKECLRCGSTSIRKIQYSPDHPGHFEEWSELDCNDCGYREGRWSKRELKGNDYESIGGEYGDHQFVPLL